jgi:exocyst complex component 4
MSLVKTFSKMLDSIPHDQAFTQLILNQIVTYYDKCCGWCKGKHLVACLFHILTTIAIMIRVSSQPPGGVRLKAAAALAEAGEIHDTVQQLWDGSVGNRQVLIDEVSNVSKRLLSTPF